MNLLRYTLDRIAEALEWHSFTLCLARRCGRCDRIRRRDERILSWEIQEPATDESGAYLNMEDFVPTARARYRRRDDMPRSYDDKVREAFEAVCARDPEGAASPADVVKEMQKRGTLSQADTVIDIADIMRRLFGDPGRP